MSTMQHQEKIKILSAIKAEPNCNSFGLDGDLVHELYDLGYFEGLETTDDDTFKQTGYEHEYSNLKITDYGQTYLNELRQLVSGKTQSKFRIEKLWIPLLIALVTVIAAATLAR